VNTFSVRQSSADLAALEHAERGDERVGALRRRGAEARRVALAGPGIGRRRRREAQRIERRPRVRDAAERERGARGVAAEHAGRQLAEALARVIASACYSN
jgi:hypothetical protein